MHKKAVVMCCCPTRPETPIHLQAGRVNQEITSPVAKGIDTLDIAFCRLRQAKAVEVSVRLVVCSTGKRGQVLSHISKRGRGKEEMCNIKCSHIPVEVD